MSPRPAEADNFLLKNASVLDQQKKSLGFRIVRLVQEPLAEADRYGKGTTFLFEVNGVRMFMGGTSSLLNHFPCAHGKLRIGSNWVPADSFLTTVTPDRYRSWLQLMKDGNQNMVRLWGGGVYELDVFYDICDGELAQFVKEDKCMTYVTYKCFVSRTGSSRLAGFPIRLRSISSTRRVC